MKVAGIDGSTLAPKKHLAGLKYKVDNLDVNKLRTVPADLNKQSNLVDNDVVQKTGYIIKFNAIDTKLPRLLRY